MLQVRSDEIQPDSNAENGNSFPATIATDMSFLKATGLTDLYEQRIEELWIEREVLRNMLIAAGIAPEAIGRCLREAKTSAELWDEAHKQNVRRLAPRTEPSAA